VAAILALPGSPAARYSPLSYRCGMPLNGQPSVDQPAPEDIGARMTIRMHDSDGGYRDILGILETPTSIRKRDGSIVTFDPNRIAIWRKIPPRVDRAGKGSPLTLRIDELERVASATWPALEQVALGDWILRASGKFTMRANSVLALGEPNIEINGAIDRVIQFYKVRDLTPTFHIALPTCVELDALLERKGWREKIIVHVMVADISLGELSSQERAAWEFAPEPSDEWLQLQNDAGAKEIMLRYPATYAGLRVDGNLIAVGRAANFEKWTVITRLFVHPEVRRRGLGKALLIALLHEASNQGATKALLQVDSKNTHAVALYKELGFTLHHAYKYRLLQPGQEKPQC
jgi:GNAT superfamily N-acetyltransferase